VSLVFLRYQEHECAGNEKCGVILTQQAKAEYDAGTDPPEHWSIRVFK